MFFACGCGHIIRDGTDNLPFKAYVIAHQDMEDLSNAVDREPNDAGKLLPFVDLSRPMYQCTRCFKIFIEDQNGTLVTFFPEEKASSEHILSSMHGDKWKRILSAEWIDPRPGSRKKGSGWINYSHTETNHECFKVLAELEARYYELFDELRNDDRLRFACLRRNHKTIHQWSLGQSKECGEK